jgi:hypothetical protein
MMNANFKMKGPNLFVNWILSFLFLATVIFSFQNCTAKTEQNAARIFLPIDVSRSGASVSTDFEITDERLYIFYLDVHYRNEQERQRIVQLVGDTARSNTGDYPSTGVPLSIQLHLAASNTILDVTKEVKGSIGHGLGPHGDGEYIREIHSTTLRRGIYHMKLRIIKGSPEFNGIQCGISIGVQPDTRPIYK